MRVLDTRTGTFLHCLTVGSGFGRMAVDERRGHLFFVTEGTYANGQFAGNSVVRMLDRHSGALLRTVGVGLTTAIVIDAVASRALVSNGRGRVDSHGRLIPTATLSVLDTRSGALLRTVPLGKTSGQGPMAVDEQAGRAFLPLMASNSVSVLDTHTGVVLRTVALRPTPVSRAHP